MLADTPVNLPGISLSYGPPTLPPDEVLIGTAYFTPPKPGFVQEIVGCNFRGPAFMSLGLTNPDGQDVPVVPPPLGVHIRFDMNANGVLTGTKTVDAPITLQTYQHPNAPAPAFLIWGLNGPTLSLDALPVLGVTAHPNSSVSISATAVFTDYNSLNVFTHNTFQWNYRFGILPPPGGQNVGMEMQLLYNLYRG